MLVETSLFEHDLLLSADKDFAKLGETDKKCPRCGNAIICEETGSSYTIRCKTEGCIKADFRGI